VGRTDGGAGARPTPEELAALADGVLPAERAEQIARQAADDPEVAAELADQRRAVELFRAAAADAEGQAPAALREGVDRAGRARRRSGLAGRGRLAGGVAVGLAVLAAAAVLVLPPGGGGPGIAEAAAVGARPATAGPPPADAAQPALLAAAVEGVAFPDWQAEFGWTASGQRADEFDGRDARTVVYGKGGKEVAYTIVSGDRIEPPDDARDVTSGGVDLALFTQDGRRVVTWERDGRTCVLSAVGVDDETLVKLAVWQGEGAVRF
jgi:anti-sigma factor RsiW